MSSRWYPLYQKGNPQLRIFLPNCWMKMMKPKFDNFPRNRLMFMVSNEMSKFDVKNYLEKIYNVPVVNVHIYIHGGETKRARGRQYIIKEDDYKVAWITLPKDYKFEFPDVFPEDKTQKDLEDEKKQSDGLIEQRKILLDRLKYKPEVPGWFG